MPRISANEIELYYEANGEGDPLVLVHGGWSDHDNWQPVARELAQSFLSWPTIAAGTVAAGEAIRDRGGIRRTTWPL